MSAHWGKADILPQGRDFRFDPTADIGEAFQYPYLNRYDAPDL